MFIVYLYLYLKKSFLKSVFAYSYMVSSIPNMNNLYTFVGEFQVIILFE